MRACRELALVAQPSISRGGTGGYPQGRRRSVGAGAGESLGKVPTDGSAYAFRNRAGNRIKLLVWDGTGVWLCVRRLHKGRFIWPTCEEAVVLMNQADWQWLTTGVDWRRLRVAPPANWRV